MVRVAARNALRQAQIASADVVGWPKRTGIVRLQQHVDDDEPLRSALSLQVEMVIWRLFRMLVEMTGDDGSQH